MAVIVKVLVEGDGGVGKTSLVRRYCDGNYTDTKMTIGVAFDKKTLEIDGENVTLMIWDFGGEERFREILPDFCKGAHVALLVYDVSRIESFLNLKEWLLLTRNNAGDIPVILVGSKCDLERRVSVEDVADFMEKYGVAHHVETSAKNNVNVGAAFELAAREAIKKFKVAENVVVQ
ncbi:MAG: Rab family GTPase [Candidatus Jordarchaeales archaeon]